MSTLEDLKSRGHWRFLARPTQFDALHVRDLARLEEIVRQSRVSVRGWDFPHVDPNTQVQRHQDRIEQQSEFAYHFDVWRFYQSGQFVYFRSLWSDWEDRSLWGPPREGWCVGDTLLVEDAIVVCSEALEFSARLAATEAGGDQMRVELSLIDLEGRRLRMESAGLPFVTPRVAHLPKWSCGDTFERGELAANSKDIAVDFARDLFSRFNWDVSADQLQNMQAGLVRSKL